MSGVRRVVSLVPSLTEAIAVTAPGLLAGATDWCTHPAGLDVVRVRGTKNPDTDRIIALEPDLVVANFEENRPEDLEILRAAGIPVWVTVIRTLPEALSGLGTMLAACGLDAPPWLAAARAAWADVLEEPPPPARSAVVPIWRRPWMVLGRETFAGDVLARLGVANLYADDAERYPKVAVERILHRRVALEPAPVAEAMLADLSHFRLEFTGAHNVSLSPSGEDGVVRGHSADGSGFREPEVKHLAEVIRELNERFGLDLSTGDEILVYQQVVGLVSDTEMQQVGLMNDEARFGQVADGRLDDIVAENTQRNTEFMKLYFDNDEFRKSVKEAARRRAYRIITDPLREEALARLRAEMERETGESGT